MALPIYLKYVALMTGDSFGGDPLQDVMDRVQSGTASQVRHFPPVDLILRSYEPI
jgi:hypothetical protein